MRKISLLAVIVVAASVLAGCSSSNGSSASDPAEESDSSSPSYELADFSVTPSGTVTAGDVSVRIENRGHETHELVFVRADGASALPLRADGSVDEDRIPAADKLGESGDIPAGQTVTKVFTFTPGTYVAFCNLVETMMADSMMGGGSMSGGSMGGGMTHIHFAQGMATTFTVA